MNKLFPSRAKPRQWTCTCKKTWPPCSKDQHKPHYFFNRLRRLIKFKKCVKCPNLQNSSCSKDLDLFNSMIRGLFRNNLIFSTRQDVLPCSKDKWTLGYLFNRVNEISSSAVKKFFQHQLTCPPASWKMSEVCISAP